MDYVTGVKLDEINAKLDYLVNEVEQAKKANKKGVEKDVKA